MSFDVKKLNPENKEYVILQRTQGSFPEIIPCSYLEGEDSSWAAAIERGEFKFLEYYDLPVLKRRAIMIDEYGNVSVTEAKYAYKTRAQEWTQLNFVAWLNSDNEVEYE